MDVFHALDPIQLRRHAGKHVAKVLTSFATHNSNVNKAIGRSSVVR